MWNQLRKPYRIPALIKGYLILNLILSPLTLLLVLFIGIMGGGSPGSSATLAFAVTFGFVYLVPLGVFLAHLVLGKIVDTVLFVVPPLVPAISWIGIGATGMVLVVAGNVFVDNLYQFRQGNFMLSFMALGGDLFGMFLVIACSAIRIPFLSRTSTAPSTQALP